VPRTVSADTLRDRQDVTAADGEVAPVETPAISAPLTKAQKEFNRRTARVEELRVQVARWKDFTDTFASVLARDLEPLQRQFASRRMALLRRFDEACEGHELTKRERARLGAVIVDLAADLLAMVDVPDAVALHDKYGHTPHASLREPASEEPELARPESVDEPGHDDEGRRRPRSAKGLAREERARTAAEGARLSLREVYRKLASALHPDREADAAERMRKTALMQRVNRAHDDRDLLQLLTLQMQVEPLDPARLADLGDARFANYNRVLRAQAESLDREVAALVAPFASGARGPASRAPTPEALLRGIQADVAALRREVRHATEDLEAFKDVRQLKAWLKSVRGYRPAG
jgi:hypothetical protein